MTPLHWAACLNHAEIAELLIEHGAKIDARDDEGDPPLFYAMQNARIAELLIARGANPKETRGSGWTMLHQAVADSATYLPRAQYGFPRKDQAETEAVAVIKLLIRKGVNVNAYAKEWGTPLHVAAFYGCTRAARQLVASGADLSLKDEDEKTPLQVAIDKGNNDTADYLRNAAKPTH
jgi:ankyrin repeat protein